jgi:hypothetical protein
MVVLDTLHKQSNIVDYSSEVVGESMTNEAVQHKNALITLVNVWIKKYKLILME